MNVFIIYYGRETFTSFIHILFISLECIYQVQIVRNEYINKKYNLFRDVMDVKRKIFTLEYFQRIRCNSIMVVIIVYCIFCAPRSIFENIGLCMHKMSTNRINFFLNCRYNNLSREYRNNLLARTPYMCL